MYGDFEWDQAPYMFATSAYWVPLSKLVKNVTRARAMTEIEIFEGNMAELRENEVEELSSDHTLGCNYIPPRESLRCERVAG